MLAQVAVVVPVLPGQPRDTADQVRLLHIDGDLVRERSHRRVVLRVPERIGVAVQYIGCLVAGLEAIGGGGPPISTDGSGIGGLDAGGFFDGS